MLDTKPCVTQDDVIWRMVNEGYAMEEIKRKHAGNIKIILFCLSDTSAEAHYFPIFYSDNLEDVCNRYSDLFPIELETCIKEVQAINQNLYHENAMSKERLNMAKLKIPLTLYKILDAFDEEFWQLTSKKVKWLQKYFNKFKVGK